jgi:5-methylcytosine-specific restriction enzyme subunit McrC
MPTVEAAQTVPSNSRLIGRIPVRNIWLLFLYASNLARFHGQHASAVEESPDFPSLVARLLCYAVDRRLRRNLSRGYQRRQAVLTRVRGRIDILETFSGDLLSKGMIACRFEELTFDTPRNRLVRAALDALASRVDDTLLSHECARLAGDLGRQGVGGLKPSRAVLSADRMGRNDADDLLMVTLAKLVFDLLLPTEDQDRHAMTRVEKDAVLVRQLFE